MYYEEKAIKGILCYRTDPKGEWKPFERHAHEVKEYLSRICSNCGEPMRNHVGPHRFCMNGKWNNWGRKPAPADGAK